MYAATPPPLPKRTRVISVSNQKGGVGKTTTTVNFAAALAHAGARVLVIDLDPQGNASTALGIDHHGDIPGIYEVLIGEASLRDVLKPSTEPGELYCVPSTIHLAGAEIDIIEMDRREFLLRSALEQLLADPSNGFHYVFIDCPPSLGLLTVNAFVAAQEVLLPIQCEYYALEGMAQLLDTVRRIQASHLNPNLILSTILLTMFDSRTRLAQEVADEVRNNFPEQTLATIIPRTVRVSEAPSFGKSIISHDPSSLGAVTYMEAAYEMAARTGHWS
ncbi:MAG: ParA family protein [Aurantimicrobium sp.]|nr:ParA family protein [Aurantimicrobium sp.]